MSRHISSFTPSAPLSLAHRFGVHVSLSPAGHPETVFDIVFRRISESKGLSGESCGDTLSKCRGGEFHTAICYINEPSLDDALLKKNSASDGPLAFETVDAIIFLPKENDGDAIAASEGTPDIASAGQSVDITIHECGPIAEATLFAFGVEPGTGLVRDLQLLSAHIPDDIGRSFTCDVDPTVSPLGVGLVTSQGVFLSSGYDLPQRPYRADRNRARSALRHPATCQPLSEGARPGAVDTITGKAI